MSIRGSIRWQATPGDWWATAEFQIVNRGSTDLVDPVIEFTVATRQNVSKNTGFTPERPAGSNRVEGRLDGWCNTVPAGGSVTFSVGVGPNDGRPGVGPLPTRWTVNGQPVDGDDPPPPPPVGPTAPGRFRATGATATSVTVAWDASSSPAGIDRYELSCAAAGGGEPVNGYTSGVYYTASGLTPDTEYRLTVYAVDREFRVSPIVSTSGRTTGTTPPPPPPPPPGDWPASAPFVDAMGWPTPRLRKWFHQWGVQGFFLGFWTPRLDPDGWHLSWGGYDRAVDKYEPVPDSECRGRDGVAHSHRPAESKYLQWMTRDIQQEGGVIVPSVGGANGHPLEQHPEVTVDAAVDEYVAALDNYHTAFIDFDIEGAALTTAEQQARHVQALLEIRRRRPDVRISHTFAVDIDGYNPHTVALVAEMARAGYQPDMVMGMLMEMRVAPSGSYYDSMTMCAEWMAAHHERLFGWSAAQSWARLGLCPMYGANNGATADARKVTTVDHMRRLVDFARQQRVATVSGWSANRDYHAANPDAACEDTPACPPGPPYPSIYSCTHVPQQHAEFSRLSASYRR